MKTIQRFKDIFKKYNSKSIIAYQRNRVFLVSNFPGPIEQPIIDYIDCYFEIIEQNYFSIRFIEKN